MILLKRDKLEQWLESIGRNPAWLAQRLGYSRSYISLIMANRCKVSSHFIKQVLLVSHMQFETIFELNDEKDDREFYGAEIYFKGEMREGKQYYAMLDRMRSKLAIDKQKAEV